jgi:acetyl-CoA synthetase
MALLATQLTKLGLSANLAHRLVNQVNRYLETLSPEEAWQQIVQEILIPNSYPFSLHELLYKTAYPDWNNNPAPAWFPTETLVKTSNLVKVMQEHSINHYKDFHHWSTHSYPAFWQKIVKILNIEFDNPYTSIVDLSAGIESPQWLRDAKFNIANSCFQAQHQQIAIISQTEQGEMHKMTYGELDQLSNRIAKSLSTTLHKGDRVAIDMPMTSLAVAIYLGIIKAGCTVVSIADSFAATEIAVRLKIANVKTVFCQDYIIRTGKKLPLYEKVIEALHLEPSISPFVIVLPAEEEVTVTLRAVDKTWDNFLNLTRGSISYLTSPTDFIVVSCDPNDDINILFSSGTTGEPKAIPWTQCSPIKCASDAYLHHNIKPGDIFCWPTNLGWMMGPWLIFACLINKATIALYEGSPNGKEFGLFVQNATINILGVVPTMVKTWRNSACMEGLDWSKIKLFTSTGECSNIEDMLYLKHLAGYRPIIEYCGGTEISGGYITSTVIQPSAPAACTTPACGLDFVIIEDEEHGKLTHNGEVALIPPSIGLSNTLLNKDHHAVYYDAMPILPNGIPLRRHGDHIIRYPNGYYRVLGRVDDTMKLGGIKISSAEIERILNRLPEIYETAAIAIEPLSGGPSQLIVYVVPESNVKMKGNEPIPPLETNPLKMTMQRIIKQQLNPLFKIQDIVIIDALPRTASNKIMRRVLRDKYKADFLTP